MPFKPTIVAMPEDPTESPFLGFPLTEIVLEEPGGNGAAIPSIPKVDSRDKLTEATDGSDVLVRSKKLRDMAFDIDYISTAKKEQLERLIEDGRTVYLCPNVGPDTEWSFPLMRSLSDFMGRKTMANTRAEANYFWDETDKVMRSWENNETAFMLNGRWQRFLRTTYASTNRAAYPHPNSTSTGWTVFSGSPTISYTEEILTRCLSYRQVTGNKGVTVVQAPNGVACTIKHAATGLDTTNDVVATIVCKWYGQIVVYLKGPTSIYEITSSITGDGTWQTIHLGGANADSASTADVYISLVDAAGKRQVMLIDTVYIGNDNRAYAHPKIPDWHDGTSVQDAIANTDSNDLIPTDLTISFMAKYAEDMRNGYFYCGSSLSAYINYGPTLVFTHPGALSPQLFSNLDTNFSLSPGDWFHCVIRCSHAGGIELFINATAHPSNSTSAEWEPMNFGSTLNIGTVGTGASLDQGGMCHLRCDTVAWTDQQIQDHYDTYFHEKGMGVIEPVFGKPMYIESMQLDPILASGEVHWVGQIILRGLSAGDDYASIQRQEGDV